MKGETSKENVASAVTCRIINAGFHDVQVLAVPDCIGVCTVASCKDSKALATSHAARGEWSSLIRTHPLLHMMLPLPITFQILRCPFCVQFCVFSC